MAMTSAEKTRRWRRRKRDGLRLARIVVEDDAVLDLMKAVRILDHTAEASPAVLDDALERYIEAKAEPFSLRRL
jgi:hypothetical protein